MGRISFVLVLVLVSTIGGGCYKIGGIKIENCVTTDCNELFPTVDTDFELNCTGCGGLPYLTIQYKDNFVINCENEPISHVVIEQPYVVPFCPDTVFKV